MTTADKCARAVYCSQSGGQQGGGGGQRAVAAVCTGCAACSYLSDMVVICRPALWTTSATPRGPHLRCSCSKGWQRHVCSPCRCRCRCCRRRPPQPRLPARWFEHPCRPRHCPAPHRSGLPVHRAACGETGAPGCPSALLLRLKRLLYVEPHVRDAMRTTPVPAPLQVSRSPPPPPPPLLAPPLHGRHSLPSLLPPQAGLPHSSSHGG